jgi:hypothetical protein
MRGGTRSQQQHRNRIRNLANGTEPGGNKRRCRSVRLVMRRLFFVRRAPERVRNAVPIVPATTGKGSGARVLGSSLSFLTSLPPPCFLRLSSSSSASSAAVRPPNLLAASSSPHLLRCLPALPSASQFLLPFQVVGSLLTSWRPFPFRVVQQLAELGRIAVSAGVSRRRQFQ